MDYKTKTPLNFFRKNGMTVGLYKSKRENKKYVAIVFKDGKKIGTFHFGDTRYQHFKDLVSDTYRHLDHNDNDRRRLYRIRHKEGEFPSSAWFAYNLLW